MRSYSCDSSAKRSREARTIDSVALRSRRFQVRILTGTFFNWLATANKEPPDAPIWHSLLLSLHNLIFTYRNGNRLRELYECIVPTFQSNYGFLHSQTLRTFPSQ